MYKKCVHGATQEENYVVFSLDLLSGKVSHSLLLKILMRKLRSFLLGDAPSAIFQENIPLLN